MFSIICSVSNTETFKKYLEPSIELVKSCYKIDPQVILVEGTESIFKNYNVGLRQTCHQVNVFIHQDVALEDPIWVFKMLSTFASYPECGLIGMVGTTEMPGKNQMYWESGRQYIYGQLYSGVERADWKFNEIEESKEVACIDGFFMATNWQLKFDEHLNGFHLYDMAYSRQVKELNQTIRVIDYKAHHIGAIRNDKPDFETYNKIWGL